MIIRFVRYIKEMFDTKDYKWIKSSYDYRTSATFKVNNKEYFIYFDEISVNVYSMYFFFLDEDGKEIIKLIKDNSVSSLKVISNVRNCTLEFLDEHTELEFFGYSSFEEERDDLYMLFIQAICRKEYEPLIKRVNENKYYCLVRNDISKSIKDKYFEMFIKENKIKKNGN